MWTNTIRRLGVCLPQILFLAFLCLLVAVSTRGQSLASNQKEYWPLFQGANLCAYKEVTEYSGSNILAWVCGSVNKKNIKIKYDCCPGYKRFPLANNECVEMYPTYTPIITTLAAMKRVESADILYKVEPALEKDGKDFTIFIPEDDSSLQNISEASIATLIVDGRRYSGEFKNGANIICKNGYPLKVSTYRNGLTFMECQLLTKPDFETSNGIIHITGGPINASSAYSTVLQRLQADQDLSAFTADIPFDLRNQLSDAKSNKRYTVFAPTNSAWQAAKSGVYGFQVIGDLVKQHVQDGLVCGQSLDDQKRLLGPSKSNTYVHGVLERGGSRVLEDACGTKVTFQQMDIMAGNGVVHKLNGVLQSPLTKDYRDALECLANGPNLQFRQGAREMAACGISVQSEGNNVILLPTPNALRQSSGDCSIYRNHVLTSQECKIRNEYGIGTPAECIYTTAYTTPSGDHPTVTNQYIRTRDGSRLHFGKAVTVNLKPVLFKGGVIYSVSSLNPPPTKTMMEIIRDNRNLSITYQKMQLADFGKVLKKNGPNMVFFAPSNYGWKGGSGVDAFGPDQLRNLFEMHVLKHQLIFGKGGNVDSETVQKFRSLSGAFITIQQNLDGSTFISCDGMDPRTWPMIIKNSMAAIDGIVTMIDWHLDCKGSLSEF